MKFLVRESSCCVAIVVPPEGFAWGAGRRAASFLGHVFSISVIVSTASNPVLKQCCCCFNSGLNFIVSAACVFLPSVGYEFARALH